MSLIKKLLSPLLGKVKLQPIFEYLHYLSLIGMNIGRGGDFRTSGEVFVVNYIKNYFEAKTNLVMFDVGANLGHYSTLLSQTFGEKGMIHSFEPSAKTFASLTKNTENYKNTTTHHFALGSEITESFLFSDRDESGLASLYQRRLDHFNIEMDKKEKIKIKTLDAFCAEEKIGHIHFLKIDVEGYEKSVLDGAQNMLAKGAVDFIQFEFGGCNIDSRVFFQDFYCLLNDKYQIFRVVKDGLFPINTYKETYEIFSETNFLAQRRR